MSAAATRSKFTKQLDDIEEYLRRLTEKCASDVRAAGLAATGDKGAGGNRGDKRTRVKFLHIPSDQQTHFAGFRQTPLSRIGARLLTLPRF